MAYLWPCCWCIEWEGSPTQKHTLTHTIVHTRINAHMHAHTCIQAHTHAHTPRIQAHTRTHTRIQAHTYTHTCTHTRACSHKRPYVGCGHFPAIPSAPNQLMPSQVSVQLLFHLMCMYRCKCVWTSECV